MKIHVVAIPWHITKSINTILVNYKGCDLFKII